MKSNFGKNLLMLRKEKKLTLEQLSEAINRKYGTKFSKSMISKWENGLEPQLSSVKYLSLFFDVSLNELLGFNVEIYDKRKFGKKSSKIPIVKTISTNEPLFTEEDILGYAYKPPLLDISDSVIKDLFYLKIKDNSMNKEYPEDSIVLIRRNINIKNGDDALILVPDNDQVFLREVKFNEHILMLIPQSTENKFFPIDINLNKSSVKMIGKVIYLFKEVL